MGVFGYDRMNICHICRLNTNMYFGLVNSERFFVIS